MSYCSFIQSLSAGQQPLHRAYHDTRYGFPVGDDNELYGRLILEINQAGLSWTTILNKEENFRKAFHGFSIEKIARYKEKDRNRLLADAGIIRNRLKIGAAIENAIAIQKIQKELGSFKNWLDLHHPLSAADWTALFKQQFRFMGGEIVKEFLLSTGYLPGAHEETCPAFKKIIKAKPPWLKIK